MIDCAAPARYDLIIRNGIIYDGSGSDPFAGDIAVAGDRVVRLGDIGQAVAGIEIDAGGMAIAPGFINMLSWSTISLLQDGRSQGEIRQGVTLEVFGEGESMGPLNEKMKEEMAGFIEDVPGGIDWTTLGEYLESLERRGVSPNVTSFIGATTPRIYAIGYEDRSPTEEELNLMQDLVREAMEEGAVGVGSSLIYAPAFYAKTEELISLAEVAAEYDGLYISHMRSEGNQFLEALDELLEVARSAGIRSEIYHLKAGGKENWEKLDAAIQKIEDARESGLQITADMYNYTAGATGLNAGMPPWVQEGGLEKWIERLKDPKVRARLKKEMTTPTNEWENLMLATGSPEKVLLIEFRSDELKPLTGKTLAEVSEMRGTSPEETAMDLVIEDGSRVGAVYFLMSEENVKKQIALPWLSFCSDSASVAPEGQFLESNPHPRAYGSFARLLGRYVREEAVISLQEAVRKLTSLPAENLKIRERGRLEEGYFADIVVFDPDTIQDHATFEEPHQYATGVHHVLVNGVQVLRDGEHTGATPGRVVRGPGWKGWKEE
jgi:N-acyl-D-amino-acid deacylase